LAGPDSAGARERDGARKRGTGETGGDGGGVKLATLATMAMGMASPALV